MTVRTQKIPNSPAVRRMPSYLQWLLRMRGLGKKTVSTTELADYMKLGWIVVRKDIALTGVAGRPRVGYDVDRLIAAIRAFLGWSEPRTAALVGAGALGSAILGYDGFDRYGLRIGPVFDADGAKAGTTVRGHAVLPLSELPAAFRREPPDLAILCVPAAAAQEVADLLVRNGVRCLWNFASVTLETPPDVVVRNESLAEGFAMLAAKMPGGRSAAPRGRRRATRR